MRCHFVSYAWDVRQLLMYTTLNYYDRQLYYRVDYIIVLFILI
jgi:hypothetical protein